MDLTWWSEHSSELPLLLLTAVVTHLLMSFSQTLMHYGLGHRQLGGIFFRNHIHFHHVHYSKDHLVSLVHIKNDGNNTPFFLIPVGLMLSSTYFIFPLGVFLIQIITAFVSFSAHVYPTSNTISPGHRFYDLRGSEESSSYILFIIHMATAILPSSTIFGTDFWVPTEVPMRMMLSQASQFPHQFAGSGGQAGIFRGDTISCTLGRQRSGPSIDMWSDCR